MTAHPLQAPALMRFGQLMAKGETANAEAVLNHALAQEPNLPLVHVALAKLRWPGPNYRELLAWLHHELQPGIYVEIGVEKGESLALAQAPTRAIGIDPAPVGNPLDLCTAPTRLYPQTSADFLRAPADESGLAEHGFNLAFIDGNHQFESVLDDFILLEAWAAPGAVIVLHDTLPLTEITASPQRQSGFYTGDGWKIVPCLRGLRPQLRMVTLPVAPTGLTLVMGLEPTSRVLTARRADILASYSALSASEMVARPEFAARPLGVNAYGWVRRWLDDGLKNVDAGSSP
jgi:predicted O-methyltransferase YrrM